MLTAPLACAGVLAVMVVALTTTTLVAFAPPKTTLAPLWNPPPLMVTGWPPDDGPFGGVTAVTVTLFASGVTVTLIEFVAGQLLLPVMSTCNVSVPAVPAVKVMLFVPMPAVMVPLVMDQLYVAPAPALATVALWAGEAAVTLKGAVMVASGSGMTVVVMAADVLLQPLIVTVTEKS